MKVVSWNMRRATRRSTNAWKYLAELNPDLAFLQEVNSFPDEFKPEYKILHEKAISKNGRPQMFGTAIVVKGTVFEEKRCRTEWRWVNEELARFEGCFVAARVELSAGPCLQVMSVHSPAWPVDRERLKNIDTTGVQLTQNRDVWGTELVWAMLRAQDLTAADWIVAGDFNSSETFDTMWLGGPRGNKEFLERMSALGFVEALRDAQGELTATFRNPRTGDVVHQIDHMFVGNRLSYTLKNCFVGDQDRVFGNSLSDHLPIIAEFETAETLKDDCAPHQSDKISVEDLPIALP